MPTYFGATDMTNPTLKSLCPHKLQQDCTLNLWISFLWTHHFLVYLPLHHYLCLVFFCDCPGITSGGCSGIPSCGCSSTDKASPCTCSISCGTELILTACSSFLIKSLHQLLLLNLSWKLKNSASVIWTNTSDNLLCIVPALCSPMFLPHWMLTLQTSHKESEDMVQTTFPILLILNQWSLEKEKFKT